jgi:hypothetical protein
MNSLYIRSGNDFYTARTNCFQQIILKRDGQVQGGFSFIVCADRASILYDSFSVLSTVSARAAEPECIA